MRSAVVEVRLVGIGEVVPEAGRRPVDLALDRLGVRVEQELGGVAPEAGGRLPRAVHPPAVVLAGTHVGQVDVPDVAVDLGDVDPNLVAPSLGGGVAEQAQLDTFGDAREDREVGAGAVVRGTQRIGGAQPTAGRMSRTWLGHPHSLPGTGPAATGSPVSASRRRTHRDRPRAACRHPADTPLRPLADRSTTGSDEQRGRIGQNHWSMSDTGNSIERIGVVGCGLMGSGIAEVCARAGLRRDGPRDRRGGRRGGTCPAR